MREEEKDEISAAAEGGGWSSFFVSMMSSGVDEERGKSLNFSLPLSDLTGGVGPAAGLLAVPEDHLIDGRGVEARSFETGLGRMRPQVGRRQRRQRTPELADGGADRRRQDDGLPAAGPAVAGPDHVPENSGLRFSM